MSQEVTRALQLTQQLLEIEKKEDYQRFEKDILLSPLKDRKVNGQTWYPIVITQSEIGLASRLVLQVERTTELGESHKMQNGHPVALFCNNNTKTQERIKGTITKVKGDQLTLMLEDDELPDWINDGKLGIDLLFDETTYKEMERALDLTINAHKNRLADLRDIILGGKDIAVPVLDPNFQLTQLNDSQNRAVNQVLATKDVAIIHGPPGTGKTTTLVQAIAISLKKEKQVLVCSPSNLAVDLLVEKLSDEGINTLRIGNPSRVTESVLAHTLDAKMMQHDDYAQIKKLRKEANETRKKARKFKRNFGEEQRAQRKELLQEARNIGKEAYNLESYITQQVIEQSQVIACTLVGVTNRYIRDRFYPIVFVDEAAQALEPACWIPITKAHKVVLAGDHCQLPPTVKSLKAAQKGLDQTLLQKLIANKPQVSTMLDTQYRMHQDIMGFSNLMFYDEKLKASELVKEQTLGIDDRLLNMPVEFVDTAGAGYQEKEEQGGSCYNKEEGDALLTHLQQLLDAKPNINVGIISPYKAQVNYLQQQVLSIWEDPKDISIGTVDSFQGQEREVIYISLVRSNEDNKIGFLSDIRRMNVAMTRAKKKLVIFGDSATLGSHPFYLQLLQYVEQHSAYRSVFELLY